MFIFIKTMSHDFLVQMAYYPVDKAIDFLSIYLQDSDLCGVQCSSRFKQPEPDVQKAEYKKNKARGIGEQWQRKGSFAAFTSLLSSFVVDLVVVVVVFLFFSGSGGGGLGVSLLYVLNLPALHYLNAQKKKLSVNIYCKLPVPILM